MSRRPSLSRRLCRRLSAAARRAWAAPWTLVGLLLALPALLLGARARVVEGVVEVGGGRAGRALARWRCPFCAITLGHVVLGWDEATLRAVRAHERVHVRQYERWGPLFVPAYLLAGAGQALRGGHAWRDNPFEREAFAAEPAARVHTTPR